MIDIAVITDRVHLLVALIVDAAFADSKGGPGKTGLLLIRLFPEPATTEPPSGATAEELEKRGLLSKQAIESATGLSPATIHRHLSLWVQLGYLEKVSRGRWRRTALELNLDSIADKLGTADLGAQILADVARRRSTRDAFRAQLASKHSTASPVVRHKGEPLVEDDDDWEP